MRKTGNSRKWLSNLNPGKPKEIYYNKMIRR
jgi:hypothetical protein